MATMNISLPDQMKEWVEAQALTGRYSNASDYVRDLIRRDQERGTLDVRLREAIAEADKGEFISAEAIHRWMEQLDKDGEAAPPAPDVFVRRTL
ncbi:MAG: type II toxin-antitoxin system ParD family antitoxin [Hyphomicrobiales bacterium]